MLVSELEQRDSRPERCGPRFEKRPHCVGKGQRLLLSASHCETCPQAERIRGAMVGRRRRHEKQGQGTRPPNHRLAQQGRPLCLSSSQDLKAHFAI